MIDFDDHFACERLRIGERLQHVVNRTTGDALVLEHLEPVCRRLVTESPVQFRPKLFQVSHSVGAGPETRIVREVGRVQRIEHAQPILLVGTADDDPCVRRFECLIRGVQRMCRAHCARSHAGRKRNR